LIDEAHLDCDGRSCIGKLLVCPDRRGLELAISDFLGPFRNRCRRVDSPLVSLCSALLRGRRPPRHHGQGGHDTPGGRDRPPHSSVGRRRNPGRPGVGGLEEASSGTWLKELPRHRARSTRRATAQARRTEAHDRRGDGVSAEDDPRSWARRLRDLPASQVRALQRGFDRLARDDTATQQQRGIARVMALATRVQLDGGDVWSARTRMRCSASSRRRRPRRPDVATR